MYRYVINSRELSSGSITVYHSEKFNAIKLERDYKSAKSDLDTPDSNGWDDIEKIVECHDVVDELVDRYGYYYEEKLKGIEAIYEADE